MDEAEAEKEVDEDEGGSSGKLARGKKGNHAVPSQEDDDRVIMEGERWVMWKGDKNKYAKDGKPSGEKGVWLLPKPMVTREKGDEEDHADGEVAGEKGDEEGHADGEEGDSEVEEEEARESLRRWNLLEREFCKVSLIPAAMKSTDPCLKKMKALSEGGQSSFSAWLLHLSLDNTILIVKALSLVGPTKVNT